jgi:hypothetical protein
MAGCTLRSIHTRKPRPIPTHTVPVLATGFRPSRNTPADSSTPTYIRADTTVVVVRMVVRPIVARMVVIRAAVIGVSAITHRAAECNHGRDHKPPCGSGLDDPRSCAACLPDRARWSYRCCGSLWHGHLRRSAPHGPCRPHTGHAAVGGSGDLPAGCSPCRRRSIRMTNRGDVPAPAGGCSRPACCAAMRRACCGVGCSRGVGCTRRRLCRWFGRRGMLWLSAGRQKKHCARQHRGSSSHQQWNTSWTFLGPSRS